MSIDFGNPKEYLSSKLDDLLEGIGETYGNMLMDELIIRLETTITDFNNEINSVVEILKEKESNRQDMLKKIKSGEVFEEVTNNQEPDLEEDKKPAWEEKIEKLEKKK